MSTSIKAPTLSFDQGRPGTWPNGERQSVRDAYDRLLAEQQEQRKGGKR